MPIKIDSTGAGQVRVSSDNENELTVFSCSLKTEKVAGQILRAIDSPGTDTDGRFSVTFTVAKGDEDFIAQSLREFSAQSLNRENTPTPSNQSLAALSSSPVSTLVSPESPERPSHALGSDEVALYVQTPLYYSSASRSQDAAEQIWDLCYPYVLNPDYKEAIGNTETRVMQLQDAAGKLSKSGLCPENSFESVRWKNQKTADIMFSVLHLLLSEVLNNDSALVSWEARKGQIQALQKKISVWEHPQIVMELRKLEKKTTHPSQRDRYPSEKRLATLIEFSLDDDFNKMRDDSKKAGVQHQLNLDWERSVAWGCRYEDAQGKELFSKPIGKSGENFDKVWQFVKQGDPLDKHAVNSLMQYTQGVVIMYLTSLTAYLRQDDIEASGAVHKAEIFMKKTKEGHLQVEHNINVEFSVDKHPVAYTISYKYDIRLDSNGNPLLGNGHYELKNTIPPPQHLKKAVQSALQAACLEVNTSVNRLPPKTQRPLT